ncbi:MAG: hypothetical protein HJHJAOHD_00175 [Flavobacteriales bacterium]|nr:hypothetical protein [Flavobacteriales bacterium]
MFYTAKITVATAAALVLLLWLPAKKTYLPIGYGELF